MAKKYRYHIGYSAEGTTYGYVDLTKKEASIVAYALDERNWKDGSSEMWSGTGTWIDIDNPMEIPDE
jgi:hypothetical protein